MGQDPSVLSFLIFLLSRCGRVSYRKTATATQANTFYHGYRTLSTHVLAVLSDGVRH